MSSTWEMLSYMSGKQRALWIIGAINAFLTGLTLPGFAIVFGQVVETFDPSKGESILDVMANLFRSISILGGIIWIIGYIDYALLQSSAE